MHPIFQSPLHRGNHFNRGDIFTGMSKTLNFSPLFIGEITSTGPSSIDARSGRTFQSPLHRGNHFNLIDVDQVSFVKLDFSPLFIGEITSTRSAALLFSV